MKTDTSTKITAYIKDKKQVTARELVEILDISERAVFKQLAKLSRKNIIDKVGKPPKVYYFLKSPKESPPPASLPTQTTKTINQNYLIITPSGQKYQGVKGFYYWCQKNHQPFQKTAQEYINTLKKYNQYKKSGFIDGTPKLAQSFTKTYLDKLYYLDFYSIERFGKTKLGWLLLYAKQSQNKSLIKDLTKLVQKKVLTLIKKHSIDAVGFIPPTIKRDVQLMKELENNLRLKLPSISIIKIKTPVIVAQKTLPKLADRVENADKTFLIKESRIFNNLLIIDDAVGSGATINQTAKKIRQRGLVKSKIYGLAITGSFKGFEIISEV